nr:type II secretion system F family protein [uncultured Acetatifactor sp.]
MELSLKRRDYHKYCWGKKELLGEIMKSMAITALLAGFFYRSLWAVIPLSVAGAVFFRNTERKKAQKARDDLTVQFRECILSVSSSLRAGYALENAFLESREDMELLYGKESMIYEELELIQRGLLISVSLEEQLTDLAERSGSPEIQQFAGVLVIAKRNGGNMEEIIKSSCDLIGQRIAVRQEIQTILSGRELEQKMMKLMPFAISVYIGLGNPGYFDALYHNLQGAGIMTICLGIYIGACILTEVIMQRIMTETFF